MKAVTSNLWLIGALAALLGSCANCGCGDQSESKAHQMNANQLSDETLHSLVKELGHSFQGVSDTLNLDGYKSQGVPGSAPDCPVRKYFLKKKLLFIYLNQEETKIVDCKFVAYPANSPVIETK